jgi:uncharacterized protein (DUF2141 family)
MKPSTKRNAVRWLHIGVGSVIATYIYSPLGEIPVFQLVTKAMVIPLTIISGLWLWKGHLLKGAFSKPAGTALSIITIIGTTVVLMSFNYATRTTLNLEIKNVKKSGTLYVNFCTKPEQWSSKGKYHFKFQKPNTGKNSFVLDNIPEGTYAVAIFQDNNDNGKLDENIFGAPKEPFGFSNNIVPKFSAPEFEECKFLFSTDGQVLSINLLD